VGRTMALGSTQPLTAFMCRLSRYLGASTSWNPRGLSRPVMGLRYSPVIRRSYQVTSPFQSNTPPSYGTYSFVQT
jgi:hypothetical protein